MEAEERQKTLEAGRRPFWVRYGSALGIFIFATLLQWFLQVAFPYTFPFAMFFLSVAATAWFGETRPALFVMILGFIESKLLFTLPPIPARHGFFNPPDTLRALVYFATSLAVITLIAWLRKAQTRVALSEKRLRENEARLLLAVDTAELGLYDRDLVTNTVIMDATCRKIMGLPAEGPLNNNVAVSSLHPEDRDRILPIVARAFDPHLRVICGADFRILTPQGQIRWVSGRGRVIFDDSTHPPRPLRFLGVLQDISPRKELELEIKRHSQELEERVAERTAHLRQTIDSLEGVLYHVAHDLRAPLRAMHNFSNVLVRDYADKLDPAGADHAHRISTASARMDLLIRDLISYGRMGRQTVAWSLVDLNGLFERVLSELKTEVTHCRADIRLQTPLPVVWGDSKILEEIIRNLLINALKFTPPETPPRIHVWGESCNGTVSLSIRDYGIGIASEYHERIFGIFERLHESEMYPGTGIGLAIVKKGVELLGGRVEVESELGHGSRFVLKLKSVPKTHGQCGI